MALTYREQYRLARDGVFISIMRVALTNVAFDKLNEDLSGLPAAEARAHVSLANQVRADSEAVAKRLGWFVVSYDQFPAGMDVDELLTRTADLENFLSNNWSALAGYNGTVP